jgi:hypothetical protein
MDTGVKMANVLEIDVKTGVSLERDFTADELEQRKKDELNNKTLEKNLKLEAEAKETARQAILDRLGLSADEAKLLLG